MRSIVDATMRSNDVIRDQARALKNKLQPMLGYLSRLRKRMAYRGFTQDDPLLRAMQKTEMAMHELHVAAHHLACGDTAGGLPKRHSQPQHDGNESRGN
jgi:hypothetical protein